MNKRIGRWQGQSTGSECPLRRGTDRLLGQTPDMQLIRTRVLAGFYDRPDVVRQTAACILESGDLFGEDTRGS